MPKRRAPTGLSRKREGDTPGGKQDREPGIRADARRNRERLLAAAGAAFRRAGTQASLEAIAREAGVGVGTLYRHFPKREALIEALVRDSLNHRLERASELLCADTPLEALRTWLREMIGATREYRGLAEPLALAADPECDSGLSESCLRLHSATVSILQRAQQAGEVRPDVEPKDLIAMVNAIAWAADHEASRLDPERLLSLVVEGLRLPSP